MVSTNRRFKYILDQYRIWKDSRLFYKNQTSTVDLSHFLQLPCYYYTEIDAINNCDSDIIAIDCLTESVHADKYFRKYNRDKYYVILSGGTWDKHKNDIGIKDYEIMYYCFFLFKLMDTYMSPHRFCFYLDKNYKFEYPKNNIFCSTIGNVRTVRDKVVDAVIKNVEYKNYILRYSGENLGALSDHLDVMNFVKGEFDPYTPMLPEYDHNVSQTLPIEMYNNCYFNLVVETDIMQKDSFFITEKTMKAIITGIPFVIISTPFFLKNLQSLGFRTYNTLWDESYDNETGPYTRIDKIAHLLNQLGSFDWQASRFQLQEIANHNLRNLLNSNTILNDFFEKFEHTIEKINERRC